MVHEAPKASRKRGATGPGARSSRSPTTRGCSPHHLMHSGSTPGRPAVSTRLGTQKSAKMGLPLQKANSLSSGHLYHRLDQQLRGVAQGPGQARRGRGALPEHGCPSKQPACTLTRNSAKMGLPQQKLNSLSSGHLYHDHDRRVPTHRGLKRRRAAAGAARARDANLLSCCLADPCFVKLRSRLEHRASPFPHRPPYV